MTDAARNIRLAVHSGRARGLHRRGAPGKAVQVEPIKPMLKAPGTKCLNLKCDKLLSSFAFNFNLRRYSLAGVRTVRTFAQEEAEVARYSAALAGAHTPPLFGST